MNKKQLLKYFRSRKKIKIVQQIAGIFILYFFLFLFFLFIYLFIYFFFFFFFLIIYLFIFAEACHHLVHLTARGHQKSVQIPRSMVISDYESYPSRGPTNHRKRTEKGLFSSCLQAQQRWRAMRIKFMYACL